MSKPNTELVDKLEEIITPSAYGFDQYHNSSCPECMFDFKEARADIKQLIIDEKIKAVNEILAIGKERAENDKDYQLWAYIEDMETYLDINKPRNN